MRALEEGLRRKGSVPALPKAVRIAFFFPLCICYDGRVPGVRMFKIHREMPLFLFLEADNLWGGRCFYLLVQKR